MHAVLNALRKSLTTTHIFFIIAEGLTRAVFDIRDTMVREVPLPYAFGDEYGPKPPWLDQFDILQDDDTLICGPYRLELRKIADDLDVPVVDSAAIVQATRREVETELETSLGLEQRDGNLPTAPRGQTTVLFRVYKGTTTVPKGIFIVGAEPQLGARVPNTIAMHDDGTGGDQKAGDGVWTYIATLPSGKTVSYIYTNSGTPGVWNGLDLPHIREISVPDTEGGQPLYLPIETFGRVYLQSDDWHTNAVGLDLVAHAVAKAIEGRLGVRASR